MNRDIGLLESVILNKILSNGENIVEMYCPVWYPLGTYSY